MNLTKQIEEAEAQLVELRRRAEAASTCAELGCDMQFKGGANAGCAEWCGCSVSVHVCSRCGDSDYGDNPEADEIRARCAEIGHGN